MTLYAIIDNSKRAESGFLTPECFVGSIAAPSRKQALAQLISGLTVMLRSDLRREEITAFNAAVARNAKKADE